MGQPLSMDLRVRLLAAVDDGMSLHCYPTLDHSGLEFSALPRSGGLVSPAEFTSMIGGIALLHRFPQAM